MTKKDFILIAKVLQTKHRANPMVAHQHNVTCICTLMADALQKQNPRFERGRFLTACMPEEDACESFKADANYLLHPSMCINCGVARKYHADAPAAKGPKRKGSRPRSR